MLGSRGGKMNQYPVCGDLGSVIPEVLTVGIGVTP
jgi:hypothetical protein